MDKNNYYFFIYNGLPPNNSYFQKVITNILTQKHGVIQNKRYICNLKLRKECNLLKMSVG